MSIASFPHGESHVYVIVIKIDRRQYFSSAHKHEDSVIQNIFGGSVEAGSGRSHVHASRSRMWGAPVIRGTRIPTYAVHDLASEGISPEDIQRHHYPILSIEQITEALEYEISITGIGETTDTDDVQSYASSMA
jgi:uncharacterized protein (DUF433 family)